MGEVGDPPVLSGALRPTFRRFVRIVRVGGPAALHFMFDVGSWAVLVFVLVGQFSQDQLAASNDG